MKIDQLSPEDSVFHELGARLSRVRRRQRISQAQLAEDAGIGVATLRRMERGQDAQLGSWVKVLRALRMVGGIDGLLPADFGSPMDEALKAGATGSRRKRGARPSGPFRWGDESP